MTRLITMDEAAARLRVSRRTMQSLVQAHPYYRLIGRKKLFTEIDLLRLIQALPMPDAPHRRSRAPIGPVARRASLAEALEMAGVKPRKPGNVVEFRRAK